MANPNEDSLSAPNSNANSTYIYMHLLISSMARAEFHKYQDTEEIKGFLMNR